ncbi:MAG: 4-demethylwyosine synthase TYW1 [Candidatus Diapherotrites archaeon]|jgi:tRNA wybutosine-synthesizing protein 1|uniref:4-demethylwyosine synthase TYW1 n=1 Tax=Candidatus Iainarchaeum sp. TaxID=3101447 RepID=A0A8T5GDT5_9ARCH|nr:4-demethylwyosine synthase TYW1 [Candidatus Diapherotrites archaeon]MBT7241539.1 4-demethylwyosine synthase TYW1 [Candidatus Diapherotrites archaeon]
MKVKELVQDFEKKKYGFAKEASIQVCEWNRDAIRTNGKEHCYKQDFYGADTTSCHQIAPTTFWCNNACVFCWRPKEYMGSKPPTLPKPKEMIEELIKKRAKLLSGFKGNEKVKLSTFDKALEQRHWAISLSGEPTLYKQLPELISYLKKRKGTETVFLVSNGQNPKMLLKLKETKSLPTQLYISMVAPEEKLYKSITKNKEKNGWKKYLKSLAMLKLLPTRTVIRFTLIKGKNDGEKTLGQLAEVLETVAADFVEIKAYMWIGMSRKRLVEENMPSFAYTKSTTKKLLKLMPSYKLENQKEISRILLFKNKKSKYKTKIIDR